MIKQAHFANHLGKKILLDERTEFELSSVSLNNLIGLKNNFPIPLFIEDCRMIFYSLAEIIESGCPRYLSVMKDEKGDYILGEDLIQKSPNEIQKEIIASIAECSGITSAELFETTKCRRPELVLPRQIYMTVLNLFFDMTLKESANVFNKRPSTAYVSKNEVANLMQTDRQWRKKYHKAWKTIHSFFPKESEQMFNLDWLEL